MQKPQWCEKVSIFRRLGEKKSIVVSSVTSIKPWNLMSSGFGYRSRGWNYPRWTDGTWDEPEKHVWVQSAGKRALSRGILIVGRLQNSIQCNGPHTADENRQVACSPESSVCISEPVIKVTEGWKMRSSNFFSRSYIRLLPSMLESLVHFAIRERGGVRSSTKLGWPLATCYAHRVTATRARK